MIIKVLGKEISDTNPRKLHLLTAAYTLLTSLGRSKEVNKKIIREAFQDQHVEFFDIMGKQLADAENNTDG